MPLWSTVAYTDRLAWLHVLAQMVYLAVGSAHITLHNYIRTDAEGHAGGTLRDRRCK
jgi:hypothetical protein